jgi:endonuclease/exonuclease/phosphatase family metal-dependent hydrolase
VVQLRVASPGGATVHVGSNTASNVWSTVPIPATGDWQNWTTVSLPVTLGAGTQQMTLLFDSAGSNLDYVDVITGGGASASSGTGASLPVITWNIEIDGSSEAHAREAMDLLVATSPAPQVVVIQEAYSQWFDVYLDELQRQTGVTWHGAFATHCASGDWNGSNCVNTWYQGVGIFSTYDIVDSSSMFFPFADCWTSARTGLRAALAVNGRIVQVFTTHLQTGGCADDAQSRDNSMGLLKAWAGNYSTPQIVAGDFNAGPDQIDTTSGMLPTFADSWLTAGTGSPFTAFAPSPTMTLDYWFFKPDGSVQPQWATVVQSTGTVSDHLPLYARFLIP